MKDSYIQKEKKARYIIATFLGVLLTLLLLALSFYNNPSADDFNYLVNVRQYGFFGAQYFWYIHWCGRYFSTLLLSLSPLVLGSFTGYKLMSFFLIILSLGSFYFFVNKLFEKSVLLEKLYITFLCFFLFIILMPSLPEAYYWMAGAYSYQSGNILTLLLFILMISYKERPSIRRFVISLIVVVALAGTNEYSMMFLVIMLLFINISYLIRKKKINSYYLTLFIVALAGSLVVYFAPGNSYRASFQPDKHQLLFSIKNSIIQTINVIINWWWVGIFIIITTVKIAYDANSDNAKNRFESIYLNPFLIIVLIFTAIAAGFFSCYWSLGLYPPMRTINSIYFYFIIGSVFTGISFAVLLKKTGIKIPGLLYINMVITILLIVYLCRNPYNINTAYHDLKDGVASRYNTELHDRYNKLYSDDCKICPVTKLENIPKSLYFSEISEKTDVAMLRSYAAFFNKDSIYIQTK